jgi:hypothetical protein
LADIRGGVGIRADGLRIDAVSGRTGAGALGPEPLSSSDHDVDSTASWPAPSAVPLIGKHSSGAARSHGGGAGYIRQLGVSQDVVEGTEEEPPKGRARRTLLLTTREIGDVDGGNSQIGHEGTEARRGPG